MALATAHSSAQLPLAGKLSTSARGPVGRGQTDREGGRIGHVLPERFRGRRPGQQIQAA
ncbi:hypothetical protein LP419_34620 [Massilia sp. H-1]|nr:hypothetical protein LP419_34620 [Massilia sp. H-1]